MSAELWIKRQECPNDLVCFPGIHPDNWERLDPKRPLFEGTRCAGLTVQDVLDELALPTT